MKKTFLTCAAAFIALVAFSLPGMAEEASPGLEGVANLRHPTSSLYLAGQPQPAEFAAFARAGVKHAINLRHPMETPGVDQGAIAAAAGMTYHNIPIASSDDLTRENVRTLDALLGKFGDEKVLVYCASSNRVGALMALRAAWIQKMPAEEAIELGKSYGMTRMTPSVEALLAR